MSHPNSQLNIPLLTVDDRQNSMFSEHIFEQADRGGMLLTDRINAQNFRLRQSEPGYEADWHMAGDPTLIAIQAGTLRIILRDGSHQDFKAGDMFIAADNLPEGMAFDAEKHGHQAKVVGDETLRAVHIKLGSPF